MKHFLFKTAAAALFLAGALTMPAHAKGVSGAIFTTTFDGSLVNGNQYNSKCDVYLDGGPGPNAPAKAAGLPDGDYYFQVTDPSGAQLLSTDTVEDRRFTVTGGVISAYGGPHPQGVDQDHGAITIGLAGGGCPADFLDTPNGGGVYKVWATPVSDYVANQAYCGGGCFHGFVSSKSKTDNFKANLAPATPTFCLTLGKQLRSLSGVISPGVAWKITVVDPLGGTTVHTTGADGFAEQDCGLTAGEYIITEEEQGSYSFFDLLINGVSSDPVSPTLILDWEPSDDPNQVIQFVNQDAGIG